MIPMMEKRRVAFAAFRHRKAVKIKKSFFMYFWGQKYQKPPHVVFRGRVRAAALHGARKIKLMRHPVADAPQPAPSFSASNESADLLCRRWRHCLYMAMRLGSPFQLTFPACLRLRVTFVSQNQPPSQLHFSFSARRSPTWFRWRKSGRRAESASGGDGLLANPRSRPTPLSAFRTPTSESVGWLLLLFATEKQGIKKKFSHVLLGPKVPKASARRFPREGAIRGAARGAQDQAYAPPRSGRAAARTLFFRVKRECGTIVPPLAALFILYGDAPRQSYYPQGGSRLGSDGGRADGRLKATAAGTVCLQTRAVARRRFQMSGRRHRNRSGGFCCFSPSKSR